MLADCAAAPEPSGGEALTDPPAFRLADLNGDGAVSAAEWEQRIEALFGILDDDASGFVEFEELGRRFGRLDEDGDGLIEIEEMGVLAATADRDGDGGLSDDELAGFDWQATGIDANLDGRISRSEFRRPQRRTFDNFDRDEDDLLQADEVDDPNRFPIVSF